MRYYPSVKIRTPRRRCSIQIAPGASTFFVLRVLHPSSLYLLSLRFESVWSVHARIPLHFEIDFVIKRDSSDELSLETRTAFFGAACWYQFVLRFRMRLVA